MGWTAAGAALIAAGGYTAAKMITPSKPRLPQTPAMPDQTVIDQQQKLQAALALGRTGRSSTILSAGSDAGTSDRLGP